MPPRIKALKSMMPDVVYLSPNEVTSLVDATPPGLLRSMILVALGTGLRFCELVALEWADVDLQLGQICVRRAEVRNQVGPPKSNRIRYIPMTGAVAATLSTMPRTASRVFHRSGRSVRYVRALEELGRACHRAGIRHASWHVLRHTFASDLARLGVPIQMIKELLGHATMNMTLRYAHLSPSALRQAIGVLDAGRNALSSNCHLAPSAASFDTVEITTSNVDSPLNHAKSATVR